MKNVKWSTTILKDDGKMVIENCIIATSEENVSIIAEGRHNVAVANACEGSMAIARGDGNIVVATGSYAVAKVADNGVAICNGYQSVATGDLGTFLVLCEQDKEGKIVDVQVVKVDGKTILPGKLYKLVHGEVVPE